MDKKYTFKKDFKVVEPDASKRKNIRQAIINGARWEGAKITTRIIKDTIYIWIIKELRAESVLN